LEAHGRRVRLTLDQYARLKPIEVERDRTPQGNLFG
jgi:hypothetical protein